MTVLLRFLEDRRRSSLWWAIGVFGAIFFTMAFYPSVKDQQNLDQVLEDLPPTVQALFGFEAGVPISSAPGYLQLRLFASLLTILLLVLAIATGAAAIGGNEEDGGLELLLSNPVTRARVFISRYLALVFLMAGYAVLMFAGIFAVGPLFGALERVQIDGLFVACFGCGLIALLHGSIAFAVGAWTGRRSVALAAASAVAAGGYLAQGVLTAADVPEPLRYASPWYWFLKDNMLAHGPNISAWLPALVLSPIVAVAAWPRFRARDLQ